MKLGERVSDEGTPFFRSEIQFSQDALELTNRLPHFEADLTTHGLQLFNNFEQAECILIFIFVHFQHKHLQLGFQQHWHT
jgi:hypothetical protein